MIVNSFPFPINGFMYLFFLACNYSNTYTLNPNLIFKLEGNNSDTLLGRSLKVADVQLYLISQSNSLTIISCPEADKLIYSNNFTSKVYFFCNILRKVLKQIFNWNLALDVAISFLHCIYSCKYQVIAFTFVLYILADTKKRLEEQKKLKLYPVKL